MSGDKDAVVYWPDKSVGEDTSFLIRRARLIFYGDVTDIFICISSLILPARRLAPAQAISVS